MLNSERLYKDFIDYLYDGVYFVDNGREINYWNKSAENITGFSADEVVGSYCYDNILRHVDDDGNQLCIDGCPLGSTIKDGKYREAEVYLHHKDGHRVPVFIRTSPVYDDENNIVGGLEIFSENSDRIQIMNKIKELEKIAMVDQLTEIPNRRFMVEKINEKINEYEKMNSSFGVIFIDIDHFKNFNDKYGHDIGDLVLKTVAKTFINNITNNGMIGRWGGEEFIGFFEYVSENEIKAIANKIRILVSNSHVLTEENEELSITISVGATIVKNGDKAEDIIKRADELMYKSKINGRDQVTIG